MLAHKLRRKSSGGGGAPSLTYRGHGRTSGDPSTTADARSLNYNTVLGGSAPVAGSLVCWLGGFVSEYWNAGSSDFCRITAGGGWEQNSSPTPLQNAFGSVIYGVITILAKEVTAGDISSPVDWCLSDGALANAHAFWIAYDVTGSISSLTIPLANRSYNGASAPSNLTIDSSALTGDETAITMANAIGTDGSIQLSGITLDYEETQNDIGVYFDWGADVRYGAKLDVGGASYTLSKGDDGALNGLGGGYVKVA
jgi:hypothetical protein